MGAQGQIPNTLVLNGKPHTEKNVLLLRQNLENQARLMYNISLNVLKNVSGEQRNCLNGK